MKRLIPYILVISAGVYFCFFYNRVRLTNKNALSNSSIDYCTIEKKNLISILKNGNLLYDLNESDIVRTSIFGNSSLHLNFLESKVELVSKSLKQLGFTGEKTEKGYIYNIDITVEKRDSLQFLFVPCCLIITSLP